MLERLREVGDILVRRPHVGGARAPSVDQSSRTFSPLASACRHMKVAASAGRGARVIPPFFNVASVEEIPSSTGHRRNATERGRCAAHAQISSKIWARIRWTLGSEEGDAPGLRGGSATSQSTQISDKGGTSDTCGERKDVREDRPTFLPFLGRPAPDVIDLPQDS